MDDRELRTSIDHESKIRDQIAMLTGKLQDALDRADNASAPALPILKELEEEGTKKAKSAPKKKRSLKDGPKRTISVQLPPEVFEKIQQDELRDDMGSNQSLEDFMNSQGLEEYTKALQRRGFNTIPDLANLQEDDIDFKVKPVHRSRLLWVAQTQRAFLEEDGQAVPDTKKVKPAEPDEEEKKPAARKKPTRPPAKKPGAAGGAAKKPAPGAKKPGSKPPTRRPPPKKGAASPKPQTPPDEPPPTDAKPDTTAEAKPARAPPKKKPPPKKVTPTKAEEEEPVSTPTLDVEQEPTPQAEPDLASPTSDYSTEATEGVTETDESYYAGGEHEEYLDDDTGMMRMDEYEDEYPIIEDVPGVDLPPQPENITRLVFGNGPFGITVYGTGNGLVVTHVEPEGSGAEMRVEVGDHVVELNGVEVPPNISDREFVEQLMSKSRPVVLGFTRNGKDFTTANAEMDGMMEPAEMEADANEPYTVGGISMDEIDPEKNLADLFPSAGLEVYLDALKEMGAEKMEDLAYLRRSDLMDLDIDIAPADKKKLLELGLVAFLTKEGLADCVAYIRSVGVDMVDDLVYLKQSDVALMDLKQEYKDRLMDVLGRDS